jgi:hypothetical protein
VLVIITRACSSGGQVEGVAVEQLGFGDVGTVDGEGGDNVQAVGVGVGVCRVVGGPVEGAGAEATGLDVVGPVGGIDAVEEVIFELEAVLVVLLA